MFSKTKAIILQKTNYSESSLVVQAFTENHGRVSLIVPGVRKKKSKTKTALFAPLSILEITADFSKTDKLIRPNEVKISFPFQTIPQSIFKSTMVLFLSEIINKSLRDAPSDPNVFKFIEAALMLLENETNNPVNFHTIFLLKMTHFLGFHPQNNPGNFLDMQEGICTSIQPVNKVYLTGRQKELFLQCLGTKLDKHETLTISNSERRELLENVIKYYQLHIPSFGAVKSLSILEMIFI